MSWSPSSVAGSPSFPRAARAPLTLRCPGSAVALNGAVTEAGHRGDRAALHPRHGAGNWRFRLAAAAGARAAGCDGAALRTARSSGRGLGRAPRGEHPQADRRRGTRRGLDGAGSAADRPGSPPDMASTAVRATTWFSPRSCPARTAGTSPREHRPSPATAARQRTLPEAAWRPRRRRLRELTFGVTRPVFSNFAAGAGRRRPSRTAAARAEFSLATGASSTRPSDGRARRHPPGRVARAAVGRSGAQTATAS